MDDVTLAYLAGVVDSDGFITIQRSRHSGHLYFGARVGITGTRREPHDLAASIWGGKVSDYEPRDSSHRTQFQWSKTGDGAVAIIDALLPHLRVKRRQAEIALELQAEVLPLAVWLYPATLGDHLHRLTDEMRELNQARH